MDSEFQLNLIKQGSEIWNQWRCKNPDVRPYFFKANLEYVSLARANLSGVDLSAAELNYANLRDADLSGADLSYADLSGADLRYANLLCANLSNADLSGADLSGANLSNAVLNYANLRDVDLSDAGLSGADLGGAKLEEVRANYLTLGYQLACPEEGSFIAWKKANGKVIKLLVTEDSKRSSATTSKCRVSKVKVLGLFDLKKNKLDFPKEGVPSNFDSKFIYKLHETIEVDDFNEDRWNECSTGIHCFLNFGSAASWQV